MTTSSSDPLFTPTKPLHTQSHINSQSKYIGYSMLNEITTEIRRMTNLHMFKKMLHVHLISNLIDFTSLIVIASTRLLDRQTIQRIKVSNNWKVCIMIYWYWIDTCIVNILKWMFNFLDRKSTRLNSSHQII